MNIFTSIVYAIKLATLVVASPGIYDQIALLQGSNSTLLKYPTQYTQGIIPKSIHSHNDCTCELFVSVGPFTDND